MRKIYLIVVVALFIVIGINYYNFLKFQKDQVEFQKEVVLRQTRIIGGHLEKTISNYQNDLTKILFLNTQYLPEIFSNEKVSFIYFRHNFLFYHLIVRLQERSPGRSMQQYRKTLH